MKLLFQVTYSVEVEPEQLGASKPEDFLKEQIEEDPDLLFDSAEIVSHKLLKFIKDEGQEEDEDDDDALTELDEDELIF